MLTKSRQWLTKSTRGAKDLVIRWSRTNNDTCRDRGRGVADTLLRLGLMVWASKPPADGFAGFGPQKPGWNSRWHMVSSGSSHRGEAISLRAHGRRMHGSLLGPFCP